MAYHVLVGPSFPDWEPGHEELLAVLEFESRGRRETHECWEWACEGFRSV